MDDASLAENARAALTGLPAGVRIESLIARSGSVDLILAVPASATTDASALQAAAEAALRDVPGVTAVRVMLTAHRATGPAGREAAPARGAPPPLGVPGVRHIIAVASGKGGVGKSTVAANLAVALARQGMRTGLLDADIYGPSVPHLLGAHEKPDTDGKMLKPVERHGIKAMSIGFIVDVDTPMIWRGAMVMSALTQMLTDVSWAPLDILVVDMPPGTGDAQLTLAQRVKLAGAVIVSTPQDLALIDARKAIAMFRKTAVPILGLVENMSLFVCPACGHETHIFGHGGARETAARQGLPVLGEIPLTLAIREACDAGTPIVTSDAEGPAALAYMALAARVREALAAAPARAAPRIRFV